MFDSSLPIAYFIINTALLAVTFIISLKSKKPTFIRLNDAPVLYCYALLSALAISKCSHFTDAHSVLSIAILPVLTRFAAGYYPFQLVNVYSIYRAINESDLGLGHVVLTAVLHSYLLFVSLDKNALTALVDIKDILLCAEERRLSNIQKTRDLILDDLKELPERMLLQNIASELKYNVDEPLFLLRAIIRVMWRPLLPLYGILAFTTIVTAASMFAENMLLHFIELPSEHSWYSGYMYIILEFVLDAIKSHMKRVESYAINEINIVHGGIKLHLFRLPLLNNGLQKNSIISKAHDNIQQMIYTLKSIGKIIAKASSLFAPLVSLYMHVGWLALTPLGMILLHRILKKCHKIIFGDVPYYDTQYKHDSKVDEIFHNIKSIKMYGWEKVYTDPKIQEYWKRFDNEKRRPWYAAIASISSSLIINFYIVSETASSLIMFYFHLNSASGSSQPMSTIDMLWINRLASILQMDLEHLIRMLGSVFMLVEYNYNSEKALKGSYINTLPHFLLDRIEKQIVDPEHPVDCSKPSIYINSGEFAYNKDGPVLKGISLSVDQGELVAVVGATGSGKSSLLLSICGEVEMTGGEGAVVGSMALVEQTPWIMSGTLRENILFGHEYDEEYYNKVIYACALVDDIKNWVGGDLTVIGERGINISGGQKARLALARAVYSRADIYILDDPLSAVDAHVKRHLLDHVIMDSGLLAGKIRIMSLNSKSLLPYFDKVLSFDDSKCVNVSQDTRQEYQPISKKADVTLTGDEADTEESSVASDPDQTPDPQDDVPYMNDKESMLQTTKKEWSNWDHAKYVLKMCGAPTMVIILFSAALEPISIFVLNGLRLDTLKSKNASSTLTSADIQRYFLLEILAEYCRGLLIFFESHVRRVISEKYLQSWIKSMFIIKLIHAPLSFFDSTTRQEISSAYNHGTEVMSTEIPEFLMEKTSNIVSSMLMIYRVATNAPQMLLCVPLFIWANNMSSISLGGDVCSSLEDIEMQLSVEHEKVDNMIADGKRLIRIFNVEKYFTQRYIDTENKVCLAQLPTNLMKGFFDVLTSLPYDVVSCISKMLILAQVQIFQQNMLSVELDVYVELVGGLTDSVMSITDLRDDALRFRNRIKTFRQYMDMDGEKIFVEHATVPEEQWPSAGKIELQDFSMKYREDLEYVLKDINLTINPGEKIGIVGRTGAGKTSLTRALFRLVDSKTCNGSIVIDGHDIFSLNIGDLRPKLGIIPQEPTMFAGSFRQNLDPLVKYSIEDMWSAIIKCGIVEKVQPKDAHNSHNSSDYIDIDKLEAIEDWNKDWEMANWKKRLFLYLFITKPRIDVTDVRNSRPFGLRRHAGNSFSDGQMQIFGLCRLLMRNRKIIVLDEATANVDMETDQQMQKLIRSKFKDCTVITIAHRLETIMNSDRVIVMDNGRISEIGPPTELLEDKGHFAGLVEANDFGQ